MDLLFFLFIIIILFSIKSGDENDFLSKDQTINIKGIATLGILFHHITTRGFAVDYPLFGTVFCRATLDPSPFLGMFFFLSGYGIMKNFLIKGKAYLSGFVIRRVDSVIVPYLFAALGFFILQFVRGEVTMRSLFGELFTEDTIVPYSWYIFAIFLFYLFFYFLAVIAVKCDKYIIIDIGMAVLLVLYCLLGRNYLDSFWFRCISCFELGILVAHYEKLLRKNIRTIVPITFSVMFILYEIGNNLLQKGGLFANNAYSVILIGSFLLILSKVRLDSSILRFLGEISLEIYLIQGLFTYGFRSSMIMVNNGLLYAFLVLGLTIPSAFVMHKLLIVIRKPFKKMKKI